MKKIITLVTSIVIMIGTSTNCFAETVNNTNTTGIQVGTQSDSKTNTVQALGQVGIQVGNVITLNLDYALNNIEKVNPDIKIRDKKIKILDIQYNYDKNKSIYPDYNQGTINYDKQTKLSWQTSLNNLNNEKHDRDEKLKSLKNDLQRQYLNAITDQQDMDSVNAQIVNLDKSIEQTNLKIKLGQVQSTALDTLLAQKSDLQSTLNSIQSQLESELLTIKQYLGISLTTDIKLIPIKKDFIKFDETNINNRLENALKKNYDLQKQEKSIELIKAERDINLDYLDMFLNVRTLELSINQAQDTLDNSKLTTQINIIKAYYDLKNKEDAVQTEKLNLEIAQNNFDSTETKFKSGMVNSIEEANAKITLEQQKTKLQRAINDYMVTSESFKNLLQE